MQADGEARGDHLSPAIREFLMGRPKPEMLASVLSGIRAGGIAAAAALVFLSAMYVFEGGDPLLPTKLLALKLYGVQSHIGTPLGIVTWLSAGICFGGFFGVINATLVGRLSLPAAVGAGATYGVLLWIVVVFIMVGNLWPGALILYAHQLMLWASILYGGLIGFIAWLW